MFPIEKILLPNIDIDSIENLKRTMGKYPDYCLGMMGLHPCSVGENYREVLDQMEPLFEKGNYVGVGETGIDLYWDTTFRKEQRSTEKALPSAATILSPSPEIEALMPKPSSRLASVAVSFARSAPAPSNT